MVDMKDPDAVMAEVRTLMSILFPSFDFSTTNRAFQDVKRLFLGEYSGYRACNTEYHNLQHTTDCFLAMARLIHGVALQGESLTPEHVTLGLLAALFHDTGYIQTDADREGTGAKYTLTHIQRSIHFLATYFKARSLPEHFIRDGKHLLQCTGLNVKIHEIVFSSHKTQVLGKMLGTADLLGQMADRTYLEKLLFLFHEFQEGEVPSCRTEIEFLKKTVDFFEFTRRRLAVDLGDVRKFMAPHFKNRWNIETDLYEAAIDQNRRYLHRILKDSENGHRPFLRRGEVTAKLAKRGFSE